MLWESLRLISRNQSLPPFLTKTSIFSKLGTMNFNRTETKFLGPMKISQNWIDLKSSLMQCMTCTITITLKNTWQRPQLRNCSSVMTCLTRCLTDCPEETATGDSNLQRITHSWSTTVWFNSGIIKPLTSTSCSWYLPATSFKDTWIQCSYSICSVRLRLSSETSN